METLVQSPSIERFSYTWLRLANLSPSIEASVNHDEASFIEMDPRLPPSKRFIHLSSDFIFEFPLSPESSFSVQSHEDELIFNGSEKNITIDGQFDPEIGSNDISTPCTEKKVHLSIRIRCRVVLRRFQRMSKRLFQKYLAYLLRRPMFHRTRGNQFGKSFTSISPRSSSADCNWRKSCDSETSIYEAVLHCKRNHGS